MWFSKNAAKFSKPFRPGNVPAQSPSPSPSPSPEPRAQSPSAGVNTKKVMKFLNFGVMTKKAVKIWVSTKKVLAGPAVPEGVDAPEVSRLPPSLS